VTSGFDERLRETFYGKAGLRGNVRSRLPAAQSTTSGLITRQTDEDEVPALNTLKRRSGGSDEGGARVRFPTYVRLESSLTTWVPPIGLYGLLWTMQRAAGRGGDGGRQGG